MQSGIVRSRVTRVLGVATAIAGLALATAVTSCGSSTEPGQTVTPKDTVPA